MDEIYLLKALLEKTVAECILWCHICTCVMSLWHTIGINLIFDPYWKVIFFKGLCTAQSMQSGKIVSLWEISLILYHYQKEKNWLHSPLFIQKAQTSKNSGYFLLFVFEAPFSHDPHTEASENYRVRSWQVWNKTIKKKKFLKYSTTYYLKPKERIC